MLIGNELRDFIIKATAEAVTVNSSLDNWAKSIGVHLWKNQLEILDTILNPAIKNIAITAARGAGKTFIISIACIKLCIENRGYRVLLFGPKAELASRILADGIRPLCLNNPILSAEVDWDVCTKKEFRFKNGSWVRCLGASETTQVEGYHADMIVTDESHQISTQFYNLRVSPMNSDSKNPKNIKIGITMYDNHFRQSCKSPKWKWLNYPWYKCENIYNPNDLININGVDYPHDIVDRMPLSMKLKRWPNNPEVQFESSIGMSEEDFKTQYEMQWVDSISGLLTGEDQAKLEGDHDYLYCGLPDETYYFGLDCAGGSLIREGVDRDYTELVIGRITENHQKQVVALYQWQGDLTVQVEEIMHIITNVFPCAFGCADYSTMGTAIVDQFLSKHIPIAGIAYKKTDPISGKNYKNSLFDQFLYELRHDRFKYPSLKSMLSEDDQMTTKEAQLLNKHLIEWGAVERRRKAVGINDDISAPKGGGYHDDCVNATALFVWACDKCDEDKKRVGFFKKDFKFVMPKFGSTTTQARNNLGKPSGSMWGQR